MARDIKVRLTPEGVADVIRALQQVQREGTAASREANRGVTQLRTALGGLRSVLGTLGVATSIAGFAAIGAAAFRSANEVIDAAKRLQVGTEEYSRLAEAAKTANVEIGALEAGIRTLQRNLALALNNPNGEQSRAFRQIRIEAEAFRQLPLEQKLATIADRVSKLSNEEDRLLAVQQLLGRGAGDLLPLFTRGAEGLTTLTNAAAEAGKVLTNETAAGIDNADAAVKRLKSTVNSFSTQVLAGLSILLLGPPDEIQQIDLEIEKLERTRARLLTFATFGSGETIRRQSALIDAEIERLLKKQRQILQLDPQAPAPAPTVDPAETDLVQIDTPEQRRARLAALQARLQDELKLQQQLLKGREAADQRAYDQGLISLEAYFARREALARESSAMEISALERQIGLVRQSPVETDEERQQQALQVERLQAEIALRRVQSEQQLAALAGERATEQRQLSEEQLGLANRLDELEGRRHEAFQRNLQEEIRAVEELGAKVGQTAAETQAQIDRLRGALSSQFAFEEARRAGERALDAFNRDAEQIRRDQAAGILTQLEGENRLIALERERLEILRQLAVQLQAAALATGNPELIQQAQQYNDSVQQIQSSYFAATDAASKYRQGLETGLQSGLQDLASNIDQIRSVEDAFRSLAATVAQTMAQIAAEILSRQATLGLLRLLGVSSGIGTGATGGEVKGYAEGGAVRGRRLPIAGPDKIPALLQEQEHVIRKRAATQPGARAFLQDFNTGRISMDEVRAGLQALQFLPRMPRFAEGGAVSLAAAESQVQPAAGGSRAQLAGMLTLDEGLIFTRLDSSGFDDLLIKRLAKKSGEFRSALGL